MFCSTHSDLKAGIAKCLNRSTINEHVDRQVVSGWYFLLNQHTGLTKHLKTVRGQISHLSADTNRPSWLDTGRLGWIRTR